MEELIIELAKDSPWVAAFGFVLYRHLKLADRTVDIYQAGASHAKVTADSQTSLAQSVEAMERSLSSLQVSSSKAEKALVDVKGLVTEMHIESRLRSGSQ